MLRLRLDRDLFTPIATFGQLRLAGSSEVICETVERERDHNRASTKDRPGACIPEGLYICRRVWSDNFGCEVFEVTGVPGRLLIRIHWANWSHQLRGCISPGLTRAVIDDKNPDTTDDRGVTSSRKAFDKLMALLEGLDAIELDIHDAIPEAA